MTTCSHGIAAGICNYCVAEGLQVESDAIERIRAAARKRNGGTMRRLDGYLSRKAQAIYPDALVYCDSSGPVEVWTLERPGVEALGLGSCFNGAKQAIDALAKAKSQAKGA